MKKFFIVLSLLFFSTNANARGWKKVFKTSKGTFTLVQNMGICAKKIVKKVSNHIRMAVMILRCDMIQLPSGRWIHGFPRRGVMDRIVELNGKVFLFFSPGTNLSSKVLEYKTNGKLIQVTTQLPSTACISKTKSLKGFYPVNDSCGYSTFSGLLYFKQGLWRYISYPRARLSINSWVEKMSISSGKIKMTLKNKKVISFDPNNLKWLKK